jgi:hypothetical protein
VSPNPCLLQRLYPPPKLVCHPSVIHNLTDVLTDDHRDTIYYTPTCNCNNTTYIHNGVTKLCSFSPWINNLISPFCVVPFCVVTYCAVIFNATLFFCTQIACQRQLSNHVIILRLPQLSLEGNIAQALYKRDSKAQYQQTPNFFH